MVYYLGSKPTLGHYANTKLLDGDPQKIEVADLTPDDGFDLNSARAYPANQGRAVRAEHVPTRLQWKERAPVPDVETQHGMMIVPEGFRAVVEQFEAGVHQFLPVAYFDRKDSLLAHRYYFVACNRLDSVDRTQTTMVLFRDARWLPAATVLRVDASAIPQGLDVNVAPRTVFSIARIGEKHAWCDRFMPIIGPLVSNALGDALISEGFSGLALTVGEEV